jgi:hypothetical protein
MAWKPGYKRFIEDKFTIVDKQGIRVPFILNPIQDSYQDKATDRDIILKARQQGFSSIILARFAVDFLLKENSYSVVIADSTENAQSLLDRVKQFIEDYCEKEGIESKQFLKYNSRRELVNSTINSHYIIGTAGKQTFGRSKTITNLHFSEAAFYPDFEKLLAGALQAVVPTGYVVVETTANGFNLFKTLWDKAKNKENGFNPLFFNASDFYDRDFLKKKELELGRLYDQEYPDTPETAFITSGDCYFDIESLRKMLDYAKVLKPLSVNQFA